MYRATLRAEYGGGDVAVKVQRPDVLENVALDLLIIRRLAARLNGPEVRGRSGALLSVAQWLVQYFCRYCNDSNGMGWAVALDCSS